MRYRPLRERDIEDPVVKYAKTKGCLTRKMNGLGARSWPDRLILGPRGKCIWIEFKKPDGEPTPLQLDLHRKMNSMGHNVYIISDVEAGKALVDELVAA